MADERPDEPLGEALLELAESQLAAGHFGVAIVIAQTVVEARTDVAFSLLFGLNVPRSMAALMEVLPDRSFQARGTRTLWTELTGDDIKEPREEWRDYCTHIERRNRAAHGSVVFEMFARSGDLNQEGAEASLRAVRAILAHLDRVMEQQLDELTGPNHDQWRALRVNSPRPADGTPSAE